MFKFQCLVICFVAYYAIVDTTSVSFIIPCKPTDFACQKASAVAAHPHFTAGVPELDLPAADPIILNDVRVDDQNLKLGFKNLKVTGISKCKILEFKRDLDKSTMMMVAECPVIATGLYTLSGKLLLIPAEGNGGFTIKIDKIKLSITTKVKVVENKGEKYWKVTGFDYNFDIIKKATITLENLYGGDETRAKPIREVLENSSNELIMEMGGPIIKELLTKEMEIVKKFLNKMPISAMEIS